MKGGWINRIQKAEEGVMIRRHLVKLNILTWTRQGGNALDMAPDINMAEIRVGVFRF